MSEVKISDAKVYFIRMDDGNYGIFCFNDHGDLFLSSDYGMYGFAWRSFGGNFKEFLSGLGSDYLFSKFEMNHMYLNKKGLPKHVRVPVMALYEEFKRVLKS
jgi:hypothetical protein